MWLVFILIFTVFSPLKYLNETHPVALTLRKLPVHFFINKTGLTFTLLYRIKFICQNSCDKFHVCRLHQAGKVKMLYQFLGGLIDQSRCFIFPGNQLSWLPRSFLEQSWEVMQSHIETAYKRICSVIICICINLFRYGPMQKTA